MARTAPFKKKAIPMAVRRAIATRYGCPPGGTTNAPCHYCGEIAMIQWHTRMDGQPSYWVNFGHEMDHVIPEFFGGPTTADNLVLACRPCNRSKWVRMP